MTLAQLDQNYNYNCIVFQSRKLTEDRRASSVEDGSSVKTSTPPPAATTRSSAEGSKLLAAMESMSFDYK